MAPEIRREHPGETNENASRIQIVRALLGIPLFYKILIGNAAVVVLATTASSVVLLGILGDVSLFSTLSAMGIGALLGIILSLVVNAVLITLALRPLEQIERTARRVQLGEQSARTHDSPLADHELRRLTRVFNEMLDTLDQSRRREQELAVRLLEAEERQRQRIAKELYDDPAQLLATVLLRLQVEERQADSDLRRRAFERLREEVAEALEGIRRSARRLRPPELDDLGLVPALRALTRTASEISGMEMTLEVEEGLRTPDPEASLALYRVIQEAIANAAVHSHGTRVRVSLQCERDHCVGEVTDDGDGFEAATVLEQQSSGLGLLAMKERASYVDGSVRVDTSPGQGTRVRVSVPCRGCRPRDLAGAPVESLATAAAQKSPV